MKEMAHHGEAEVVVEAEEEDGVGAEEPMKRQILSTMEDLMVVGSAAVVGDVVVVVASTVVEAESKMLVALTSLMLMGPYEIREMAFLRICHTQIAAEEGAEVEVRVEVRGEGFALTGLVKTNLRQELRSSPLLE